MDPSTINLPDPSGRLRAKSRAALDHATGLMLRVCRIAGSASFVADAREALEAEGIHAAVRTRDTAALFDWLVSILSYQGISDQVAFDYMEWHGQATWQVIASDLRRRPSCPKLKSYWQFHDCRYNKSRYTCAEPDHLPGCPLPNHWLRNGRLNQTAYALHLFIRDVACGDLVGWIDRRLNSAAKQPGPDRLARMRMAVLDPLKEVYGVSDKILMMALSVLFLGAPGRRRRWLEVGGSMIAVDTLVHNFLHRTGILYRFRAATPMASRVTGRAAVPKSSRRSPSRSTPGSSTAGSHGRFRGSFSTGSGDTAPSKVSTSATAIRSMTGNAAATNNARYTVHVIEKGCIKQNKCK
jgi:hypothetical protein